MTDTAKRLIGPTQLTTTAATTLYTVPGATTTIIRHVLFTNDSTGNEEVTLSFGIDGSTTRLFSDLTVFAKSVVDWTGFQVLNAAEVIQASCSANSAVNITVSGVEVT
jgi:hypothetical protein